MGRLEKPRETSGKQQSEQKAMRLRYGMCYGFMIRAYEAIFSLLYTGTISKFL